MSVMCPSGRLGGRVNVINVPFWEARREVNVVIPVWEARREG